MNNKMCSAFCVQLVLMFSIKNMHNKMCSAFFVFNEIWVVDLFIDCIKYILTLKT